MSYDKVGQVVATFEGDSGRRYEIRIGRDDTVYCSCPAWINSLRKRQMQGLEGRDCKHLQRFRAALTTGDTRIFNKMES